MFIYRGFKVAYNSNTHDNKNIDVGHQDHREGQDKHADLSDSSPWIHRHPIWKNLAVKNYLCKIWLKGIYLTSLTALS